jgi:hypothetical protein
MSLFKSVQSASLSWILELNNDSKKKAHLVVKFYRQIVVRAHLSINCFGRDLVSRYMSS